ncbi:PROGRAMMED CELL DEATH 4 [Salix koriyanagi]|uniref:PROGRAMMED CELL DEATH 4 n=1 Tax=Salix koriyanagi TaxID=2511006 RepID=A0A9Q0SSN9_9ROSI|nr:PROGRAMMED CELL DEATH 4 [Salix koriyanagi]
MATSAGFLTDEQREMLETASQNAENLSSSSPKGLFPSSLFSEQHIKAPAAGKAGTAGFAGRQVRRSHSGKHVRVKKGGLQMEWL